MVTPYSVINLHCGGFPSFLMQISIFNITVYFKDLSLLMPSPPQWKDRDNVFYLSSTILCTEILSIAGPGISLNVSRRNFTVGLWRLLAVKWAARNTLVLVPKNLHLSLNFESGLIKAVVNSDTGCCFPFMVMKLLHKYSFLQKRQEEN